jgi:hypothetical protein
LETVVMLIGEEMFTGGMRVGRGAREQSKCMGELPRAGWTKERD